MDIIISEYGSLMTTRHHNGKVLHYNVTMGENDIVITGYGSLTSLLQRKKTTEKNYMNMICNKEE